MVSDAFGPGSAVIVMRPIGFVHSELRSVEMAPRQGSEGAPVADLELSPSVMTGLRGLQPGMEVLVITWLHEANRTILEVHPRGEPRNPMAGVFITRSPHRPNPLGLHRVRVHAIDGPRLQVGPLEAIDGTPVLDIKAVLD
jgi:tRNA-Thr(GGU) m(6)t(6)A37 methyltransferase TsaA